MIRSLSLGILLLFLFPAYSAADDQPQRKPKTDANITGHVESARTGEHLPYITLSVKGTTIGMATDATGHYFLKDLPLGDFILTASSVGYKTQEIAVKTVRNKTLEVNFLLEEESVSMDEVVVSATRNETNKRGAATIVNVVSTKMFEGTASTNLAETMSFQPGLRVENNCGNCGTTQLRINGLEGQYSQILLDSRPIFSSLAAVYGLEQLPVSMVERVEVVRGGGSALFGSSAIGGVVNIITKEPLRNSMTLSHATNFFEDGKTDMNTSLNGSFVSDDHRAGVYLFGMIRDRNWYDRNGDGFSDIPQINSETAGFRAYYKLSTYSRLTAEYHHIHEARRGGNNFSSPPHEADIAEYLNHKIDGGGLRYDYSSPDYRHRWGVYTSAQNIKRDSYFGAEKGMDAYGNTSDKTVVAGTQYTYGFDRLFFMPAELTAGVEFNFNDLHDQYTGLERELAQTTRIYGGFLQNEWKTDRVGILIGARIDKHNLMADAVISPRATLRYSPTEKIGLRASYSSGYRAPQAYDEDLHISAVGRELAVINLDPNLKPEYSNSWSASVDLYQNFGRVQTNLLVEGFYTKLKDVFWLDKTGKSEEGELIYYTRRNGSGAIVKGFNLEGKVGLPGTFEIQMGITLQSSRFTSPEKWSEELPAQKTMFRAPDHYGYLTANVNITRAFTASLFGNYTGSMLVQHTLNGVDREKRSADFFDMGVKLAYDFRLSPAVHVELSGGVKNLFDSFQKDLDFGPGKDAGYVYGPALPRMVFMGLKFSL